MSRTNPAPDDHDKAAADALILVLTALATLPEDDLQRVLRAVCAWHGVTPIDTEVLAVSYLEKER